MAGLVITRKLREAVEVVTPSGKVKFTLVQVKGKQVRVGVRCDREWQINRLDPGGNIERRYDDWKAPEDTVEYQYEPEDLHGKQLDMYLGVDEAVDSGNGVKLLMGKDRTTGKCYVIQEIRE